MMDRHREQLFRARIKRLDESVSNKIAAGEVVERPAAVVKELVENAIDAGATQLIVEIESGGKSLIRVTDNGCGIAPEDLPLAFERHATSKVSEIDDLYRITTLGFRGEALASIAAVSNVDLTTKRPSDDSGSYVHLSGGKLLLQEDIGCQTGTTLVIRDLFFNTPARLKFLRSNSAETAAISDLILRLSISHPEISFKYLADKKQIFMTPGDGDPYKAIFAVFEKDLSKSLVPFESSGEGFEIRGYLTKLQYVRSSRTHQIFFVNGRFVKSRTLSDALQSAYMGLLPIGKFPAAVIYLTLNPELVDVNIHPAKTEIKFENEYRVRDHLSGVLRRVLHALDHTPEVSLRPTAKAMESVKAAESSIDTLPFKSSAMPSRSVPPSHPAPTLRTNPVQQASEKPATYAAVTEETMENPSPEAFNRALFQAIKMDDLKPVNPSIQKVVEMADTNAVKSQDPIKMDQETFLPPVSESLYDDLKLIGQLFHSFLLFERHQKLVLIDQHAAHEKLLYERLRKDFSDRSTVRQILMKPMLIEMDHGMLQKLLDSAEDFERLGFVIEDFGTDSLLIREVPIAFSLPAAADFFREVSLLMEQRRLTAHDLWLERVIKAACKGAVKSNDSLSPFEIDKLISDLKGLESPYTCPHGRPIMVSVSRGDIEKMFKRT